MGRKHHPHQRHDGFGVRNCSAAKFGVEYREPERRRDLRHVVRKEKALERAAARPTFNPGLDLFSEVSVKLLRGRAPRLTSAATTHYITAVMCAKQSLSPSTAPSAISHSTIGPRQATSVNLHLFRRRYSGGGSGRRVFRQRTAWRPTSRPWTPPMLQRGKSARSASAPSTSRMTRPGSWTSVRPPASF
jgi:hypothetical protein